MPETEILLPWSPLPPKKQLESMQKRLHKLIKNFVAAGTTDPAPFLGELRSFSQKVFTKLEKILEGYSEANFSHEENMLVFNMLTQGWGRYEIENYLSCKVIPSIREKHNDECMLREIVQRWSNHKVMVRLVSEIFQFLGPQWFFPKNGFISLKEVGFTCFRELIYQEEIKGQIKDAVIALIKKEHGGKLIDTTLLKNILDTLDGIDCYYFENNFLKDITYYYVEAQSWTLKECYSYYFIKAEVYLKREDKRQYLHNNDEHKLLREIQNLMFAQHRKQLPEGSYKFTALLRGGKVEELSKIYKLFKNTCHRDELRNMFREHLMDVVTNLVRQAGASASDKKVLLCEIIELYEKQAIYVMESFQNDTLFLKVLKDSVSGSLSAEFFAMICGNIQKNGCTGNICNEAKKIYQEIKGKVLDTLTVRIEEQRKCKTICEVDKIMMALLRKVLDMLHNICPECYVDDIVVPLLNSTKKYYSEIPPILFLGNLCPDDYMNKVDEFFRQECERASHYSPFDIKQMLYEEVTYVSLARYFDAFFLPEDQVYSQKEKQDKEVDLSRLYVLSFEIWGSPKPIVVTFKMHVKNKFDELVKEGKRSASNTENFAKTIIEHYDKYEAHITKCFQGDASFYKALQKAFKSILTTDVNGDLRAQLLAAFCGNILNNSHAEKLSDDSSKQKLSDDVIEGSLHKVVRFIISIIDKEHIPDSCRNKFATILQEWFSTLLDARGDYVSKMYRLFCTISGGQETFIGMFEMHLMGETEDLVQQTKELLSKKEDFVSKIIGLYEKYEEFLRHPWFHEALRKVLEIIYTECTLKSLVSELLATFCVKIILKNDFNEKNLDKVVKLLPDISNKDLFAKFCRNKFTSTLEGNFPCHHNTRDEVLFRMYKFFSKISYVKQHFVCMLEQKFTNDLIDLVKHAEDIYASNKEVVVVKIIELHDKYTTYVKQYFQGHKVFYKVLHEALEDFCNKDIFGRSSATLLATFCNYILEKRCTEVLSDTEIEHAIDKVVRLLAYINHKDQFIKFYRNKFATRLLFNRSVNDEHEKNMLNKLEQSLGKLFTSKLKHMFTDIANARDIKNRFRDYIFTHPELNPEIGMGVTVLTALSWPTYNTFHMKLPAEMAQCVDVFNGFYQQITKNKKLSWLYSLGTCHVHANFEAKPIELIVTPSQAALLMLFNAIGNLSYPDIRTQLSLPDDDVKPLLYSLSCGTYKILTKVPTNGTISHNDVFEFNSKFTDEMNTIKISQPHAYKTKGIIKDTHEDKSCTIDATIMRIMKRCKVMLHEHLVSECVKKLMFKADVKDIKKRIGDLITREYLERDEDNANKYKYIPG